MSYDIKFKQRAVEYQREGHTYKETCKVFKISETTLTRWINKEKEGKLGEVKIQVRKPKKILSNGRSRWRHEVFRRHVAQAKRIFYS